MQIFYAPNLLIDNVLPEEESQHAIKVLRLSEGDTIDVVNGQGLHAKARITLAHPKHCAFETVEEIVEKNILNYQLHIAIAPTKNIERLEWFIEKTTEIGIGTITPIVCSFSERKIVKPERLEKIIVSAAKQSLKYYFPTLAPLTSFEDFMKNSEIQKYGQTFIAHCHKGEKQLLKNVCKPNLDTLILIGPEGDFSSEEVKMALDNGFTPVSLGNTRLRTETAGIVACCTLTMNNEQ